MPNQVLVRKRHAARHFADVDGCGNLNLRTLQNVTGLAPCSDGPKSPGNIVGMQNCHALNGAQYVPVADSRPFRRSGSIHLHCHDAVSSVGPDRIIGWKPELLVLLIVHPGCNRGSDGEDRQQRGRELESQFLKHGNAVSASATIDTGTLLLYVQFGCQRNRFRVPAKWLKNKRLSKFYGAQYSIFGINAVHADRKYRV